MKITSEGKLGYTRDTTESALRSRGEVRSVIRELQQIYVKLARDEEFRCRLDELLEYDEDGHPLPQPVTDVSTKDTRGIVVIDGAGGGKSSLVRHALETHPALQPTATTMPCISISVPSPATMKSVSHEILKASRCEGLERKREAHYLWNDVRHRFNLLGTVVLWIDEAHDLFPNGSKSEAPQILKTLKSLMQREGAVIVILSGVESLWDSLLFDEQVERRYQHFELPPVATASDCKLIWRILTSFCDHAGLQTPPRGDLVERLLHAARHRFGLCIEQMISAIEIALTRRDAALDVQHFADAYFKRKGCSIGSNIFLAPRWSSIEPSRRGA